MNEGEISEEKNTVGTSGILCEYVYMRHMRVGMINSCGNIFIISVFATVHKKNM